MRSPSETNKSTPTNYGVDLDYEDAIGHLHGDSEFSGPVTTRKCTDIPFLILFVIANLGLIGISIYILIKGDPSSLPKGFDIRGHICGVGVLSKKPFMYFPNSTNTEWSLCIEACPYYFYSNYYCIYDSKDPYKYYPEWGCFDAYQSTAYGFYCVPAATGREEVENYLNQPMNIIKRASADIFTAWDIILIGYGFSMTIALIYLFLLRIAMIAKSLVIVTVFLLTFLFTALAYLLFMTGKRALQQNCGDYGPVHPEYCNSSSYNFYNILAICSSIIFSFYIFRVIKKYPSFTVGYQMIELTSKPLKVMKELALFPIAQIMVGNGILIMLVIIIGWNMTTYSKTKINSDFVPGGTAVKLKFTALENYMLAFNAGMSIWWCFFLVDLGKFAMSGGVSMWYFSRQKSVLYGPLFVSIKYALRYHIGSIALGSLAKVFRVPFDLLLIGKLAQYLKSPPITNCKIFCTKLNSCVRLYNNKIRYITNYNYTFMSIFGDSYLEAGKKAYHLMRRNNIRIGRPCKFGSFIISMVKWVIIFSGLSVCLVLILYPTHSPSGRLNIELTGLSGPILFTLVLSWFVGEVFGGALEVSLNTVLLSAACDEEMFVREQRFVENDLLEYMDGIGEEQNLYHRENKVKIHASFNVETARESFSFNKVEPDVFWTRSKDVSRISERDRIGSGIVLNGSINASKLNPVNEEENEDISIHFYNEAKYLDD